jgi:hypothetical protein
VQAKEAADGRSTNVSSRTRKAPSEPVIPGAMPPRERTKMKKEITSTTIVVVVMAVERAAVVETEDDDVAILIELLEVEANTTLELVEILELIETLELDATSDVAKTDVATTDVAREVVALLKTAEVVATSFVPTPVPRLSDETDVAFVTPFTIVAVVLFFVVVFARVIVQEVAAPFPSSWHTTGWNGIADGGHVN